MRWCSGGVVSGVIDRPQGFGQSLRAREAEWELGTFATDKYRSFTHDEQKSLRCMRSHGCVRVSLPLSPCDRVGHTATLPGFESMKMGVCLLFGRTKRPDLHRTVRPRFLPLSAGSPVLDAL
jgi:hypothetical protein